jgi:metal-sulfur cluster biosynthetic enzyme
LVYGVDVNESDVEVTMTLTFAGCGMGPYIAQQAEWRLAELDGIEDIKVDLVFEPPWTPEMITEEGKRLLGLD